MKTFLKILFRCISPVLIGFLIMSYILIVQMNLDYRTLLPIFGR